MSDLMRGRAAADVLASALAYARLADGFKPGDGQKVIDAQNDLSGACLRYLDETRAPFHPLKTGVGDV